MTSPLIVLVIQRYCAGWQPPADTGRDWHKCHCPFHGDEHASASVSFEKNAFKCHSCPVKGDPISIIRSQEEVSYSTAKRIAEELSVGSGAEIPQLAARKPSRRLFEGETSGESRVVRPRVRGRSCFWA